MDGGEVRNISKTLLKDLNSKMIPFSSSVPPPQVEGPPVEFGTVLVFSCLASCWGEGGPREEAVIVQGETM